MDQAGYGKIQKPNWTRINQKETQMMGKSMKKLLYIINVTLLMLNIVNNAEANQQNFYSPKDSFATFKQPMNQNQYIIFDEIGEMA